MTEHMIFYAIAFGPAFLACCGILWLSATWVTYRKEQKNNVPINRKEYKWAVTVGLLLLVPVIIQLIAMPIARLIVLIVMLR